MVIADYVLPGSVILLKFGLKLSTDQETNTADTLKALMVFPVDIAFLSLSYGSAILYSTLSTQSSILPVKAVLATAFLAIALLLPVIVISKKSERAFIKEKFAIASGLSVFSYTFALSITGISISIGGFFR